MKCNAQRIALQGVPRLYTLLVLILMFSVGTPLPAIIIEQQNFKEVSCFMFFNSTVAYATYSYLFLFRSFVYCSTYMEPSCYMAAMCFQFLNRCS